VQGPDHGHDHHPSRLRLALLAGAAGLALAAPAAASRDATLPSPLAPLSPSPPLGTGATATSETVRHRIRSVIRVHVSLLPSGAPFAIAADQTLIVTVKGDYFFTIGAPLLDVEALPGSDATPGLRSTSIIWEGFNPLRRTLKARASLDPAQVAPALPLRIEVRGATTTFVNTTRVTVAAFTADADPAPLVRYVRELRRAVTLGLPMTEATAKLTSAPRATRVRVAVPLRVSGTVGGRRVSEPQVPAAGALTGLSGREALARATTVVLTVARLRQYERFLGNPDPTGPSTTTYLYRTAAPPRAPAAVQPAAHGRDWTMTAAVAAGLLLAAGAALAVWARA
jgi:hypothetical protein